jgi:hypothetical protein
MNPDFWHKQAPTAPLFPELEWSRPENRQMAGKLLLVGGNLHGFAAPAEAYVLSLKAGIGTSRVLLPSAIQKVVGPSIENGEFAASTPSGSFSQRALVELLDWCKWADGILFAGDLGRNSETAIMQEKFLQKCEALTVLTKDAVDYIIASPSSALERPNTTIVLSLSQLQRLGIAAKFERPITFGMNLVQLLEWLHIFTDRFAAHIIVKHLDQIFVAVNGEVSTTKLTSEMKVWRLKVATHAAVWWIQNRNRTFEGLTTAVLEATKAPKT